MNSRERILTAINHRQPDRIPVDLGATPSSSISVVAWQNLLKHINKEYLQTWVYDVVQEVVQPEMEILDLFGVDVIDLGRHFNQDPDSWHKLEIIKGYPGWYPKWFQPQQQKDGSWLAFNEFGEAVGRMPLGATFFDQIVFPYQNGFPENYAELDLAMKRTVWGAFAFTPWDQIEYPGFWEMLREKTLDLKTHSDKAILLGVGCNLFEWGTFLRRMDNFLVDLFLNPNEVHRMLDELMQRHMDLLAHICEAVGDLVDIIKFGDDLGTNRGPLIPVETYREFFKPRHKTMCDYVKKHSAMHTMLHCCGGIYELIPELIDAGFEILNPVQINAIKMEPTKLKNEFGNDITFWGGGADTQKVLNAATPEKVKNHVKSNLEIFSKDGGYVFNTVHNIMPDVPPQNIVAMFEAVKEFNT
jgi:uroporphyrinogen decarboxylase